MGPRNRRRRAIVSAAFSAPSLTLLVNDDIVQLVTPTDGAAQFWQYRMTRTRANVDTFTLGIELLGTFGDENRYKVTVATTVGTRTITRAVGAPAKRRSDDPAHAWITLTGSETWSSKNIIADQPDDDLAPLPNKDPI